MTLSFVMGSFVFEPSPQCQSTSSNPSTPFCKNIQIGCIPEQFKALREQFICARTVMTSPYVEGFTLLVQLQKQLNEINFNTMNHRITVQTYYALSQKWNSLTTALIATGEAADQAATASNQQRAQALTEVQRFIRTGKIRMTQANICIRQFRYVTALSNHARAIKQRNEIELLFMTNVKTYYEGALGPQAHMVRSIRTFLDELSCKLEKLRRKQAMEMLYIRWVKLRASADLVQQANKIHLTCQRRRVLAARAYEARTELKRLRRQTERRVGEYEHLEREVLIMRRAIMAL